MLTLDDFMKIRPKNTVNMMNQKREIMSITRREWSWKDLPKEINTEEKAKKWIQRIRGSLNEKQRILLDLIENGTKARFVKKGNKKVQISEGLEPYSPYLLYVLWRGVNGRA